MSPQDDPFWELIPRPKHQGVDIAAKPKREPDLETLLVGASRGRRRQIVTDNLLHLVARILGLASPEGLDPARGFRDLGLDSLMAVELRNALQRSLGKRLPATVAFDYPTVATMTDHILTEIFPASESAEQIPDGTESPSRVENEVSQLSEEEAEAQLLKELTRKRKTDSHG
jgi:acyl carrier protein